MNCQTCTNPTRYPIGFWDGENSHGQIFDCRNSDCEVKRNRIRADKITEDKRIAIVEENSRNNIQMLLIKMKRKELGITIAKMAKELGVSPVDYSNYEQCRAALPVEMVDRIDEIFQDCINKHLYAPRLKPEFGAIRWDVKA